VIRLKAGKGGYTKRAGMLFRMPIRVLSDDAGSDDDHEIKSFA
jgi:hypothetical protein